VRLYYEIYGAGESLLLVHGNGGGIADLSAQIAHCRHQERSTNTHETTRKDICWGGQLDMEEQNGYCEL
jgi:hypothetical protein